MFEIECSSDAIKDLRSLRKAEQTAVLKDMEKQLRHEPDRTTRNRKKLRPGHVSTWELRIGAIRVFYEVDKRAFVVRVAAIGYKKGNKLFFRGKEYEA